MKIFIYVLTFLSFGFLNGVQAQSSQAAREQRRAERQAVRAQELAQTGALMMQLVKDTTFVLEANSFIGPFGQQFPVSSFQNFFAIVGKQVLLNLNNGNNPGWANWGWNTPLWNQPPGTWPPSAAPGPVSWNTWQWNQWGTYNNLARLTDYETNLSNPNLLQISGTFIPVPGVMYVPFQMTVQSNGSGRLTFTTDNGYQIVLTGTVVSPQNASVVEPIPGQ